MSVSKLRQAGSAKTFVIIAVILVAVTVGGIFLVVKRGEQVRNDQAATQLAQQQADQKAIDAQNAKDAAAAKPTVVTTPASPAAASGQVTTGTTALPTTGPGFDIIRMLAIGLLAGTITSFVLSRRNLKRSL